MEYFANPMVRDLYPYPYHEMHLDSAPSIACKNDTCSYESLYVEMVARNISVAQFKCRCNADLNPSALFRNCAPMILVRIKDQKGPDFLLSHNVTTNGIYWSSNKKFALITSYSPLTEYFVRIVTKKPCGHLHDGGEENLNILNNQSVVYLAADHPPLPHQDRYLASPHVSLEMKRVKWISSDGTGGIKMDEKE